MTEAEKKKWATDILAMLGLTASQNRLNFLYAWFASENTKAKNNPLATTWDMRSQGATFFNCLKKDASGNCTVGVQNYPTYDIGLNATVKTLKQDQYVDIRQFLADGGNKINPKDPGLKKAFDTWGTTYKLFSSVYTKGYGSTRKGLFSRPLFWFGTALVVGGAMTKRKRVGF